MKKWYALGAVLLLIGGGVFYLLTSYEAIVKSLVHKYGSEVTGTDVAIDGFKLSLKNGEGTISRLTVANPKGYSAKYLFSLEEITVKVDLKSLTTDTIVIEKIDVKKPIITYEMVSVTKNNISEIQKNVRNYGSGKPASAKKEETKKETSTAGKKVVINKININQGELAAVVNVQGKENKASATLPPIVIEGIGKGKDGESITSAISKVLTKILDTSVKTVASAKLADYKGMAEETLNNVVGSVKDRIKDKGIFGKK